MLDANDPAFRSRYLNGAIVRDRLGRQLWNVVACDPETGEVITLAVLPIVAWWARVRWRVTRGDRFWQVGGSLAVVGGELVRRHGFWPAPLTIEPRRWSRIMCRCFCEPLPALDNRTPEEICGYGDDGLCDHGSTP